MEISNEAAENFIRELMKIEHEHRTNSKEHRAKLIHKLIMELYDTVNNQGISEK